MDSRLIESQWKWMKASVALVAAAARAMRLTDAAQRAAPAPHAAPR